MLDQDFHFDFEFDAFEKAGAGDKSRRIGGIVSTPDVDKDNEVLIQKGLDFKPFLTNGFFNYNHGHGPGDIIGHPETAQLFEKGATLPSGRVADRSGWFVEGYLLKGVKKAEETWQLAQSLQSTNRRLGFSVEGKVTQRHAPMQKGMPSIVAAAIVKHVAVTHCPKNDKTELEVLAKSLDVVTKALAMGSPGEGGTPPAGVPVTGVTHGVLTPQHIDGYCPTCGAKKKKKRSSISKGEALAMVTTRFPNLSAHDAARLVRLAMSRAA